MRQTFESPVTAIAKKKNFTARTGNKQRRNNETEVRILIWNVFFSYYLSIFVTKNAPSAEPKLKKEPFHIRNYNVLFDFAETEKMKVFKHVVFGYYINCVRMQ